MERKEYVVELVATTEHNYTVLARTEEEACAIVQDMFDGGDEGTVTATSIETLDAFCGADSADVEEFDEVILEG